MFKVNELNYICLVAETPENFRTQRIREKGTKALLDQPMRKQKVKVSAFFDLSVDLVLTAGDREDVFDFVLDCVKQRIVGRNVAGVQGDYHVCLPGENAVARHVVDKKLKVFIAVSFCNCVAVFNNVLFEVEADNVRLDVLDFREVIIDNEREIRLSAAEVKNRDLAEIAF